MAGDDLYSMDHGDRIRGGGVGELVAGVAIGIPLVLAMGALDGARAVKDKLATARVALHRWPIPATLGTLTNADIDRLPARPGRS